MTLDELTYLFIGIGLGAAAFSLALLGWDCWKHGIDRG